jgi:hypothetical protein
VSFPGVRLVTTSTWTILAVITWCFDCGITSVVKSANLTAGNILQRFGESVSISGSLIVVGAPSSDTTKGDASGKAYLFTVDGALEKSFIAADGTGQDNFGKKVSIDAGIIAISAPRNDGAVLTQSRKLLGSPCTDMCKGAVYLFERLDGVGLHKLNPVVNP